MPSCGLQDWEKQALIDGYLAGEKLEALAVEFDTTGSNIRNMARRRGIPPRVRSHREASPDYVGTCFKCKAPHSRMAMNRGKLRAQSYCKSCHTAYTREQRRMEKCL